MPEKTINHPLVDAVCIGEGEITLVEYLDKLEVTNRPSVRGIWYKYNEKIIRNQSRPFIQNLDSLQFPNWDYWEMKKYAISEPGHGKTLVPSLRCLASRGCPFNCTFCSNKAIAQSCPGNYYRVRSAENIIEEIKTNLEKYSKNKFFEILLFDDPVFGLNLKQFNAFVKLYKKEGLHEELIWACVTRADILTDGWIKKDKDSGCILVDFGVETGNEQRRIKFYRKHITNKQIERAARLLKKYEIMCLTTVMIGYPGETIEDVKRTLFFAESLKPFKVLYGPYTPLPKTELGEMCKRGMIYFNRNRSNFLYTLLTVKRSVKYLKIGVSLNKSSFFTSFIKYTLNSNRYRMFSLKDSKTWYEIASIIVKSYFRKKDIQKSPL